MSSDYNDYSDYKFETWIVTLRSSDLQSDSDQESIRNSCDVYLATCKSMIAINNPTALLLGLYGH